MDLDEVTLKMLQETTMQDAYNELSPKKVSRDVKGNIDGILVVTDPAATSEEYDEVIERANEIVENTPEGEVPFDEEYIGQYLLTCPICGTSFLEAEILQPGSVCPNCMDTPESFVVKGRLETEEFVAGLNGLDVDSEEETSNEDEESFENEEDEFSNEDLGTGTESEEFEEEEPELQVASKRIIGDNILTETKLEETENKDLATSEEGTEVLVIKNSYGYILRGLVINNNNKQFQYVNGQSLPTGKYKQVSKNIMQDKIEQLQKDGYEEVTTESSVMIESVEDESLYFRFDVDSESFKGTEHNSVLFGSDVYEVAYDQVVEGSATDAMEYHDLYMDAWNRYCNEEISKDELDTIQEKIVQDYIEKELTLDGCSCFELDEYGLKQAQNYGHIMDRQVVTIFTGEYVGEGHDGECVVKPEKIVYQGDTETFKDILYDMEEDEDTTYEDKLTKIKSLIQN